LRFIVAKQVAPEPMSRPKVKNDPMLVAAARELRDRWLERVNSQPLPTGRSGKYDVSREFEPGPKELKLPPLPLLAG
jgi:hypothetical protein